MRLQLFTALALYCAAAPAFAQDQYKNGQELTGSWRILATIQPGVPVCPGPAACAYPAMATVISDGTVVQTAAIPNSSIGHGAWKRVGLRQFKMNALYFRLDPGGLSIGTSETTIHAQVDPSGKSVTGSFTAVLYDLNNNPILSYGGTVTATRIEVQ